MDDLLSVADAPLTGISVPKIESPRQLPVVDTLLRETERKRGLNAGSPGLIVKTQAGRRVGFLGKQVIHPKQVVIVNKLLAPTKEEFSKARAVVSVYEEGERSGKGAVALNGQMIDRPVVERARRLLALARDEIFS